MCAGDSKDELNVIISVRYNENHTKDENDKNYKFG